MPFPVGAVIALAPQIIDAVKSIAGKGKSGPMHPKVKAGLGAGTIATILMVMSQLIPGMPEPPPGLAAAIAVVVGYIAAWVKKSN